MKLSAFAPIIALSLLTLGCPHKPTEVKVTTPVETPQADGQDQVFDKYAATDIKGVRFEPRALGNPGMPKVTLPGRTLSRQRKKATKTNAKPADVQTYASMLWQEGRKLLGRAVLAKRTKKLEMSTKLDQDAQKLRAESLTVLQGLAKRQGDKVEELTLQMLGIANAHLGNTADAIAAHKQILQMYPDSKGAKSIAMWLGHLYLRAGDNKAGAELIKSWKLDELDSYGAYVWGWTKYRTGDAVAAAKAVTIAAKAWTGAGANNAYREALFIHSRAGTAFAASQPVVGELSLLAATAWSKSNKSKSVEQLTTIVKTQYLQELSRRYQVAGFYAHAIDVQEHLLDQATGFGLSGKQQIGIAIDLLTNSLRTNKPADAAEYMLKAHGWASSDSCDAACQKTYLKALTTSIASYATIFHKVYTTGADENYYAPAKKLYDYYIAIPPREGVAEWPPNKAAIEDWAQRLQEARDNAEQLPGVHDQQSLGQLIDLRNDTIKACYERALQLDASTSGTIKLSLDIGEAGDVTGMATDPAKGEAGVAAVGTCLEQRIRDWKFPTRSKKGTTRVSKSFNLALAPSKK